MMLHVQEEVVGREFGIHLARRVEIPSVFCWTKMGAEAGQGLDAILRRKELERRAGNGVFAWGIGNSLGVAPELAKSLSPSREVDVLFTPMKSAPKAIDVTPSSLLLWSAYYTPNGRIVALPDNMLVTSRGGLEKRSHYALFCKSDEVIEDHADAGAFDAIYAKNLASMNPIGASQVTSIVSYQPKVQLAKGRVALQKPYRIAFRAKLFGQGFVRLAHPALITGQLNTLYQALCQAETAKEWLDGVLAIRSIAKTTIHAAEPLQEDLFSGAFASRV